MLGCNSIGWTLAGTTGFIGIGHLYSAYICTYSRKSIGFSNASVVILNVLVFTFSKYSKWDHNLPTSAKYGVSFVNYAKSDISPPFVIAVFIQYHVIYCTSITFSTVVIFSMVVCLRWLYHHMLLVLYISWESWVLCLLLLCSLTMCTNNWVYYDPIGHIFLFAHHTTSLKSLWRYWTSKCLSSTFCLKHVSMIKSVNHLSCNIWGCAYRAHPFLPWWLWDYRKVSNIRCTKCQNLNVPRLGLQLSLRNV